MQLNNAQGVTAMKYYLLCGTALAVMAAATPASAQQNNVYGKDSDSSVLGNAQMYDNTAPRTEAYNNAPATQAAPRTAPAYIEPAAGESEFADFTGPYFGLEAGYNFGNAEVETPGPSDDSSDLRGWDGGLFIGYGFEQTAVEWLGGYLGVELGYDWSNADGSFAGLDYEKNHNWLATVRPGFSMGHDALGYGILGYSRAEYEVAGSKDDYNGYVLGLGGQFNTHTAAKIRLEYTYVNYGEKDFGPVSFDPVENDVKLGLVFQF
jgi:outer membrane immunogenic protein